MTRGVDEPWIAAASLPDELARSWARAWPDWFGPARVPLPRASEKHMLAWVATPLGPVVAKRETARSWKRSLLAFRTRPARCVRAFRLAAALRACGLATPEPLAVLGRPGEMVLVTRYVEGLGPWELMAGLERRELLLELLAEGLARLHGAGFRHRDLKASNMLVRPARGEHELVWTDLDGLARRGTVEPHVRARDLARLCTSFASAEARAAGVRGDHWPALVRLYLERALACPPAEDELDRFLTRTRTWSDRNIRRHLATDRPVR